MLKFLVRAVANQPFFRKYFYRKVVKPQFGFTFDGIPTVKFLDCFRLDPQHRGGLNSSGLKGKILRKSIFSKLQNIPLNSTIQLSLRCLSWLCK